VLAPNRKASSYLQTAFIAVWLVFVGGINASIAAPTVRAEASYQGDPPDLGGRALPSVAKHADRDRYQASGDGVTAVPTCPPRIDFTYVSTVTTGSDRDCLQSRPHRLAQPRAPPLT
jgi:hypothetical protein